MKPQNRIFFLQKTLFFSLFCLQSFFTFAQKNELTPCAAGNYPPQLKAWQSQYLQKKQQHTANKNEKKATIYMPIKFFDVGTTEGTDHFGNEAILQLLCDLNNNYAASNTGFQFYIDLPIKKINNSSYFDHDFDTGSQMMFQNNKASSINIYVVKNPAGACGYFSFIADGIAVAQSCSQAGSSTLTHEVGHYLSLPHTFSGWEDGPPPNNQREKVNGSNCHTAGDGFCDTPPDYVAYRWSCPYNDQPLTDPNGETVIPDGTLYMSYAVDACHKRFSQEQIDQMNDFVPEERPYLLGNPTPNTQNIGNFNAYYPPSDASGIGLNNMLFVWQKAQGADNYYLEIRQFGNVLKEVFTTDTFYTASFPNADPSKTFYWTVKPYNEGNTCSNGTYSYFKAAPNAVLYLNSIQTNAITCNGNNTGFANISVAGGTAPYNYLWSNGATTQNITNLEAGNYEVTVTDNNNITQVFYINIIEPQVLKVKVVQLNNVVTANITGGITPYQIQWSNGTANATDIPNPSPAGLYSITVTDANQCTATTQFEAIKSQATLTPPTCNQAQNGSIALTLTESTQPPYTFKWNNSATTQSIENLEAGTYKVTVTNTLGHQIKYTYILTEPLEIQNQLVINNQNATANTVGGTPPYTYNWNNAGFTPNNTANNLPINTPLSVVITDAQNCTLTQNFEVWATAIQHPTTYNTHTNPAFSLLNTIASQNNTWLVKPNFEAFNFLKNSNLYIQLYTTNAQKIIQQNVILNTNTPFFEIENVQTLPKGVYFLYLQTQQQIQCFKVVKM